MNGLTHMGLLNMHLGPSINNVVSGGEVGRGKNPGSIHEAFVPKIQSRGTVKCFDKTKFL